MILLGQGRHDVVTAITQKIPTMVRKQDKIRLGLARQTIESQRLTSGRKGNSIGVTQVVDLDLSKQRKTKAKKGKEEQGNLHKTNVVSNHAICNFERDSSARF